MIKLVRLYSQSWLILLFILTASISLFAQKEQFPFGEKKKIHLLPVEMNPRDSYIESQVIKSALRTLYQTGRYHIIVGDELAYKKIVI